jgi:peptidoglycan/LPS O-acetylase OafA/YrhL
MKPRILIFDILRVVAISLVVFFHLANDVGIYDWVSEIIAVIFDGRSLGSFGVFIFVVISGALINQSTPYLKTLPAVLKFYKKRFLRVIPMYMIALVFSVIIMRKEICNTIINLWPEFVGMGGFYDYTHGNIIVATNWFVTVILILYLLYPVLNYCLIKQPIFTLIAIYTITYLYYIPLTYGGNLFIYIFMFSFGLFISQQNLYSKIMHTCEPLAFLSELSFYVFLLHIPVVENLKFIPDRVLSFWFGYPICIEQSGIVVVITICMMFLLAIGLMYVDRQLQGIINR